MPGSGMGGSGAHADDGLSPREREVLALVAVGHSNQEIGDRLRLSVRAVESHRGNATRKLGVTSTADITAWALHNGQVLAADEDWSTERFLASVRQAPLMVLVADAEMRFLDASGTALEVLGYTHDELLQLDVQEIVLDRTEAARRYASYLMTGAQHGRITLRRKDRSAFEVSYAATVRQSGDERHYVSILIPE
jgi:PAS domain S-box-containing protein